MNYNYIVNPNTGRKVKITGKKGQEIIKKYMQKNNLVIKKNKIICKSKKDCIGDMNCIKNKGKKKGFCKYDKIFGINWSEIK